MAFLRRLVGERRLGTRRVGHCNSGRKRDGAIPPRSRSAQREMAGRRKLRLTIRVRNADCRMLAAYVHRTPCTLCFQFSGRRVLAGNAHRNLRQSWDAGHGVARSRWRLWLAALLYGRQKSKTKSAYWRRDYLRTLFIAETARHKEYS